MNTKTKAFLAVLIVVIGAGLIYWKWEDQTKASIELSDLKKTGSSTTVHFKMSYRDIHFSNTFQYGSVWKKTKGDYSFQAISKSGSIYFSIKDKKGAVLAEKTLNVT